MLKNLLRNTYTIIRTMNIRKSFIFFIIFIILILSIVTFILGTLSTKTQKSNDYNSNLNIGTTQNVKYYLNLFAIGEMEKNISKLLYSGLVKRDMNGNWVNDLAKNIIYEDEGRKITIELRDDIRFSNGDHITTDDIIWTYQIFRNTVTENEYTAVFDGIDIVKINDHKIILTLKYPYYEINHILNTGILSKSWGQKQKLTELKDITNIKDIPYSGAFTLSSINNTNTNYSILGLNRNENYNKLSNIKNINIYLYKNIEDEITQFNDGVIDIIYDIDNEYIKNINRENIKKSYNTPIYNFLFFNTEKANILAKNNERARIRSVINNQYIIDNILTGQSDTKNAIIQLSKVDINNIQNDKTDKNSQSSNSKSKTKDTQKATSSSPESKNLNLAVVDNDKLLNIANYIKDRLSTIGYNITINKLKPQEIYNTVIKERNYDLLIYGLEINSPSELYLYLDSSQKNYPGLNITTVYNKDLDNLLKKIKYNTNITEEKDLLSNINNILSKDNTLIPLYQIQKNIIIRKDYNINTLSSIDYYGQIFENISDNTIKTEYIWSIFNNSKINEFINKLFY